MAGHRRGYYAPWSGWAARPAKAARTRPDGLRLGKVTGLVQHGAEQPQQIGSQALIGRDLGERAFKPVPALGQQRAGEPRPFLITCGQRPTQRGAEVIAIRRQVCTAAFPLGQAQERGGSTDGMRLISARAFKGREPQESGPATGPGCVRLTTAVVNWLLTAGRA